MRQFYRTYIHAEGAHRRKLTLSIAPDPTLNTIQACDGDKCDDYKCDGDKCDGDNCDGDKCDNTNDQNFGN